MTVITYSGQYIPPAVYPAAASTLTGGGTGADFDLDYTGAFLDPSISVINNPGNGYSIGDLLLIDGSLLGGVSGLDDVILEIVSETGGQIDPGGFQEYARGRGVVDGLYSTLQTSTGGSGVSSTFSNYLSGVAGVGYVFAPPPGFTTFVDSFGLGYSVSDWIQISGDQLGGATPQDDLYLTVSSVYYSGELSCGSTVGGGYSNSIVNSTHATIVGGFQNTVNCASGAVVGGLSNCGTGSSSFVVGSNNCATGSLSSISGGSGNQANGTGSVISGGSLNCTPQIYSTVGGGCSNRALCNYSTVSGGVTNCACGNNSVVSGGNCNSVTGDYSTITGGGFNLTTAPCSTISGGNCNIIQSVSNANSVIGGGFSNCISASGATPTSPRLDISSNCFMTIGGGICNSIVGSVVGFSTIGGGNDNSIRQIGGTLDTKWAVISGGFANCANRRASAVGGGAFNTADGSFSTVGGGLQNCIISLNETCHVKCSTIGGGVDNTLRHLGVGGVDSMMGTTIGGGRANCISDPAEFSTISGGQSNRINSAPFGTIGGGCNNRLAGQVASIGVSTYVSVKSPGAYTTSAQVYSTSILGAGAQFTLDYTGGSLNVGGSTIDVPGTGYQNDDLIVFDGSDFAGSSGADDVILKVTTVGLSGEITSFIEYFRGENVPNSPSATTSQLLTSGVGIGAAFIHNVTNVAGIGYENGTILHTSTNPGSGYVVSDWISIQGASLGGGFIVDDLYVEVVSIIADVSSTSSTIGGGVCNYVCGPGSTISGGRLHCIVGEESTIGGGRGNCVCTNYSSIVGGRCNTNSGCYSIIGGGSGNTNSGSYSIIGGGTQNTVTVTLSGAVGSCNTVCCIGAYAVGNSITTVSCNTTHVVCLNITSIPTEAALPLPPGTVYRCTTDCTLRIVP
jgi:hypothetical protein